MRYEATSGLRVFNKNIISWIMLNWNWEVWRSERRHDGERGAGADMRAYMVDLEPEAGATGKGKEIITDVDWHFVTKTETG